MPAALKIDWHAARQMYATCGDAQQVAVKFGVKETTLYKRIEREGWKPPAMKITERSVAMVKRNMVGLATNKIHERVSAAVEKDVQRIVSKAVKQAEDIMDRGHSLSQRVRKPNDFKAAADGWRIGHEGARLALGLDTQGGGGAGPCVNVLVQGGLSPIIEIEPAPGYQDSAPASESPS